MLRQESSAAMPASPASTKSGASPALMSTSGDRLVFTVNEFCIAHRICRSKLYQFWKAGTGPRVMQVGQRLMISVEAAADWRREREAVSASRRDHRPSAATGAAAAAV
jgi:hypothetical protein